VSCCLYGAVCSCVILYRYCVILSELNMFDLVMILCGALILLSGAVVMPGRGNTREG
jgi:hypothetical protein